MTETYGKYQDHVEFFVVYVREAHPTDGWQSYSNVYGKCVVPAARELSRAWKSIPDCSLDLHLHLPVLVKETNNHIYEAYGPALERLYLIGEDRKIAYHGRAGPHFFDLYELEFAIQ